MKTIEETIDDVQDKLDSARSALREATAYIRARDEELEDAELFQWMCANPDEAASAINDAYGQSWDDAKGWKRLLLDEIDHQRKKKKAPESPLDVFSRALDRISGGSHDR